MQSLWGRMEAQGALNMKRLVDCAIRFAVLISASTVCAAAPGLINYLGRLTDTAGQPVTASVDVTFTFWNATVGGVQLDGFSDADMVTPDADGIYSTTIGDDAGNLIPASIFDGDSVWLNVQINGEDLLPRKRMVSVGYAIQTRYAETAVTSTRALTADQSDNADRLEGQPASAFMPAGTDNWVNTTGDSMAGRLEILAGSNTNILSFLNSSGADSAKAIEGFAAAVGAVTNYGGYFRARGDFMIVIAEYPFPLKAAVKRFGSDTWTVDAVDPGGATDVAVDNILGRPMISYRAAGTGGLAAGVPDGDVGISLQCTPALRVAFVLANG